MFSNDHPMMTVRQTQGTAKPKKKKKSKPKPRPRPRGY